MPWPLCGSRKFGFRTDSTAAVFTPPFPAIHPGRQECWIGTRAFEPLSLGAFEPWRAVGSHDAGQSNLSFGSPAGLCVLWRPIPAHAQWMCSSLASCSAPHKADHTHTHTHQRRHQSEEKKTASDHRLRPRRWWATRSWDCCRLLCYRSLIDSVTCALFVISVTAALPRQPRVLAMTWCLTGPLLLLPLATCSHSGQHSSGVFVNWPGWQRRFQI